MKEVDIKLQTVRETITLLKRDSNTCFSGNIGKFLIIPVLKNSCVRLLLKIIIKKRFLGKATGYNDHYMINMGGQRPKTGGN